MDINWPATKIMSDYLDDNVAQPYKDQPLAQDWARVAKVIEELGEAISALIGYTGQNPRKGTYGTMEHMLNELADTAMTAIYAMVHFTGSEDEAKLILCSVQLIHHRRIGIEWPVNWIDQSPDEVL